MQVICENISDMECKLHISIPMLEIKTKVQFKLLKIASTFKIHGFRCGKVPFSIIKNRFEQEIYNDVINETISASYIKALQDNNLTPIREPKIDIISTENKNNFEYLANLEIYPRIVLADFSNYEIEKYIVDIHDEDVNKRLKIIHKNFKTWEKVIDSSRLSKKGDKIIIDLCTYIGEPVCDVVNSDEKWEQSTLILGDNPTWVEFEQLLFGLPINIEKQFSLIIPDTHPNKNYAGKKCNFKVKIVEIHEPVSVPLDDEFAAKIMQLDKSSGDIEKLKYKIQTIMKGETVMLSNRLMKSQIIKLLISTHKINIPNSLIEDQLKQIIDSWKIDNKTEQTPINQFKTQIYHDMMLDLIFREIIIKNNIVVSDNDINLKIKELESIDNQYKQFDKRTRVETATKFLLENKIMDFLIKQVKIIETVIDYTDFIMKNDLENA